MSIDIDTLVKETIAQLNLRKNFYRPDEVAKKLCVSTRTIYRLIYDGELLAANRLPGKRGVRILSSSIASYVRRTIIPPEFFQE